MVQTKIGNMLVRLGNLKEANIEYLKALENSRISFSLEHMDTPSLYAAAEAYAGMGDVAAARARKTSEKGRRDQLLQEARMEYHKSLDVWKRIPVPARYGPNGYLARSPAEVAQRLAECQGGEGQ
jgi:hypothetical protein